MVTASALNSRVAIGADSTVMIWKLSDKEAPERGLGDDDVIQQEYWTMVYSMRYNVASLHDLAVTPPYT